ncbi:MULTISPECIES: M23 family metallopeptidase [Pacificimonas]|uniref:M23 family metallopeptidase n=1 Tax=Pacificimonas aurantium TaxID=1250540 RepID=A0ABS7WM81_9SPHN|nr:MULTISPECIES: M23 family metallopeptidase [Pacificimonas]MBZ6379501.1 M23 family metallopeptidase [Pacificimonas aurantium]
MQTDEVRAVDLTGRLAQGGWARGEVRGGSVGTVELNGEPVPILDDGRFFIAFGRDDSLKAELTVRYADGETLTESFALAPTDFPESHLPARTTTALEADPAFERRRARELRKIREARATPGKHDGWTEDFIRPVAGEITSVFGAQRFYGDVARSPHSGTDFAGGIGDPVVAPASGTIVLAGPGYSYEGNLIILDHGLGLYSAFLHLSDLGVETGEEVERGQLIGRVGQSGRATGPHLHWGLWWNGVRFDPAMLLAQQ